MPWPTRVVLILAGLAAAICLNGCDDPKVIITFHQVAVCNEWANAPQGQGGSPNINNQAYVLFEITSIDNSARTTNFFFDPTRMYMNWPNTRAYYRLAAEVNLHLLGARAADGLLVPAGTKVTPNKFAFLSVTTSNKNGAVEANQISYYPLYDESGPPSPGIVFEANPQWTPLPPALQRFYEDCGNINLG